jgi:hypothetical protein
MAQTDNSYLADKVQLRLDHLPESNEIRVLDCYGGDGIVWSRVSDLTDKKILRIGIDKKKDAAGSILHGDNLQFLVSMDLSRFDVIDLDAYGVPYDQLCVIFDRGYTGALFVTFIQSMVGAMPHGLLCDVGFTKDMVSKAPTLFYRNGWNHFKQFLAINGVSEVWHRTIDRKHYLAFEL